MDPGDRLVLPDEVLVFPVADLAPTVRAAIGCEPDDYAITRERSRKTTRVVDRATADLIEEFRKPTSTVDAIRRFVARSGLDPATVVEDSVPMLNEFIADGFIVPVGMESAVADGRQLRVGDTLGGWEVLEPLQIVEDTEVYRAQSRRGVEAALKRVLPEAESWVLAALRNEARVLRRLSGATVPALLTDAADADDPHLAVGWCEGAPVMSAASRLRRPWSSDARDAVGRICVAVLDAYADLHRQGVFHGDVHPRNLLFDDTAGSVHVVDFGLAVLASDAGPPATSGGIPAFFPPEYAAAMLDHRAPPPVSAASEQYSVAALLFELLTGEPYLTQTLEGRRWFDAVCTQTPRAFRRLGLPSSPALESVFARALAKRPEDRYPSVAEFRDAFAAALARDRTPSTGRAPATGWTPPGLFAATTARLDLAGELDRALERPTATVNFGSAGIAFSLYRASCLLDRPELLALADVWIERARRALDQHPSEACFAPAFGLEPGTVGATSLYHSGVGVDCIDAMIACAMDDRERADGAIARFVDAAATTCDRNDVTTGAAGHLIGCAALIEATRAAGYAENRLLGLGQAREAELIADWRSNADGVAGAGDAYSGVAHGWAGVAFALLRFSAVSLRALPEAVPAMLEELEHRAIHDADRAWWPRGPADDVVWPGWCHGSAGYAMLWGLAYRQLSDDRHMDLARRAAAHTWSEPAPMGHLCCGAAGQAYAFLCLYRVTGEGAFADRARAMLDRATTFVGSAGMTQNSLYKGDIGVALLEAELAEPFLSAMPMFEGEGWPA